jgi:hypothetical protein
MWRRVIAAKDLKAWDLNLLRIPGVICINLLLGMYTCVVMKQCTDVPSYCFSMQLRPLWKCREVKMTRNQTDEQSRHKVDFFPSFFPSFLTFSVLSVLRLALSNSPFEYRSYLQGKCTAFSLSHVDAAMSVRKCIECRVVSCIQLEINCLQ